jgi:hypothetical protein
MVPPGESTSAAREQELARLRMLAEAAEAWARWRRRGGASAHSPEERDLLAALDRLEASPSGGRRLIVLCSGCRRTRDETEWIPLEAYLADRLGMEFTHSICPTCMARLYPHHASDPNPG